MKWRRIWYFIKPWKKFFSNLFSTWEKCVSLKYGNFCRTTRIHLPTLCSWTGSENLFFHELPANQGQMTNQLRQQLRENCWWDRKIFPRIWKRTKIQTNVVPTEPRTSFGFVEETDWRWFATNYSRTFRKPRTNYANIVFANWFENKMFASVNVALDWLFNNRRLVIQRHCTGSSTTLYWFFNDLRLVIRQS